MKPLHIFSLVVMLFLFGIIFFSLQGRSVNSLSEALKKINNLTPTQAVFNPQSGVSQGKGSQVDPNNLQGQAGQQQAQQQSQAAISPVPLLSPDKVATQAVVTTDKGAIIIDLYNSEAPQTVANFVRKSESGFYNNLTFHRVEDWVIQGGDPQGTGNGGGKMLTELNEKPFVRGSVGVARGGDVRISNDSQFFITKSESPHLNNQYTNFGIVVSGMDVADKIEIGDKMQNIEIR